MIRLYHGGCEEINEIDLAKCLPHRDFGRGFYLTLYKEHARERALHKSLIYGKPPVVSVFTFDEKNVPDSLKVLHFENESSEWAEFVYRNREDADFSHQYDIVIGPIADDGLREQFRRIRKGDLSFQELAVKLAYRTKNIQYCFCSEAAIRELKKL